MCLKQSPLPKVAFESEASGPWRVSTLTCFSFKATQGTFHVYFTHDHHDNVIASSS